MNANMVFVDNFCNGNANSACDKYFVQFPNKRLQKVYLQVIVSIEK